MADDGPFSGPDPAHSDGPDPPAGHTGELTEQEKQDLSRSRIFGDDVSCDNCSHQAVCTFYNGITPVDERTLDEFDPPFTADELAAICRYYDPVADGLDD